MSEQRAASPGREPVYAALYQLAQTAIAVSFTADSTANSPVLANVSSLANLRDGFPVMGPGVPVNSVIEQLNPPNGLVLSRSVNGTGGGTGLAMSSGFRTTGRRLKLWGEVSEFPAMFMRQMEEDYPPRPHGLSRAYWDAEIWIYCNAGQDPTDIPTKGLNPLIDAIEQSLAPKWPDRWQTLGGLVTHAWIEGRLMIDPGDLDKVAKAVIPVRMLLGIPEDP